MDSQAGHSPEQPPDASGEGRWLTYDELGHIRGIGRESAVKLAQRKRWPRRPGNDGTARVCVPLDWLKAVKEHSGELSRSVSLLEATVAALREQQDHERAGWIVVIDGLEKRIASTEAERDREKAGREGERSRADVLRDRIDAMQAQIAAAAAAGEAMQAERDQARREAQEAAAWRARSLLARLRTAWRGK